MCPVLGIIPSLPGPTVLDLLQSSPLCLYPTPNAPNCKETTRSSKAFNQALQKSSSPFLYPNVSGALGESFQSYYDVALEILRY